MQPLAADVLPPAIEARVVHTAQNLDMHYLSAGDPSHPVLLLLHGFPELAFSWRKVMPGLAAAGYYVIAPDQRGYGRTTGWPDGYDVDLNPYHMPSLVLDQLALLAALEVEQVHGVIGHDFGSPVAAWCALIRPDVFTRLVMMSAPFAGPPGFSGGRGGELDQALAALTPPRRHYQWYYATRSANGDLLGAIQGLETFLAQYYYLKSGLWAGNTPHSLPGWETAALAVMPGYYIMPRSKTMAEVVAADASGEDLGALSGWLPRPELEVYASEFSRTGFQGGLNWYRAALSQAGMRSLRLYSGVRIEVPATFLAGSRDWGMYQSPGALNAMAERACRHLMGCHVVDGAGHWVQQEQPERVVELLLQAMS